jgi:hypothetical protein
MLKRSSGYSVRHDAIWRQASASTQPAQIDDEAAILRDFDEAGRGQKALVRTVPPDECLHGQELTGAQVQFGLVVQEQTPLVDGV